SHIRLQSLQGRAKADAALADWRKDFPEAGLWELPNGWFAVTLGPLAEDTAKAWLGAFRAAGRAPRDAFVAGDDKLGRAVDPGRAPDLPAPGSAEMPPLDQVQRALRWAGFYDGPIDGKDGPKTRDSIAAEIVAERAAPDAASAMQALIDRRMAWRERMGLTRLDDPQSGLSVMAPMDRLEFLRNDQGLSIYGPKDGSGAALILYSAPGGQQEMLDFTGLVTALGWVPQPERRITPGHAALIGRNDTHIGQAEARVVDGRVEGLVLLWPVMDAADQPRIAAELIDSLTRRTAPEPSAQGGALPAGALPAPAAAAPVNSPAATAPAGN
ncbi:MAG TPA: peptidoglycan-binding domain-containing protein, partial [Paracoccus sp. (in: a-proteobacteria)]|nr:peptidoglycan-binding domain-containing protein [Paracoccus sp. (in: a-proteobacteria)]